VFAEWQLVERNPAKSGAAAWCRRSASSCAWCCSRALAAWSISYVDNRNYLAEVTPRARELAQKVQATPNTTSDDLATLLPILDEARDLAASSRFNVMRRRSPTSSGSTRARRS
jgi:type VI secretion system protein ImpL